MAQSKTVYIDSLTRLELVEVNNGVAKFNEVRSNWETGNVLEVSLPTDTEGIVAAYKETGW